MNANDTLNHRAEVAKLSQIVNDKRTYNKPMYAIDVDKWGISEPFSDPESGTIFRSTIFELANATFINEDEDEINEPHYSNAPYGSIWDY